MPLLSAAVQDGHGCLVAPEQQRADADRAADLVRADRHRGKPGTGEVDLQLPERLHRVGVHGDTELVGDLGEFSYRHDGADLVVGPHHGDERDIVRVTDERLPQRLRVHPSVGVDREVFDGGTLVLREPVHGVQDGVVLHGTGQDPGAPGSASRRDQ